MTLTEKFAELFESYMSDPEADDKHLQEDLIQAVKERDHEVYPGKKPVDEYYREIDSESVSNAEGWNEALDQYKKNLEGSL